MSDHLIHHLRRPPGGRLAAPIAAGDPLQDDDIQLSLYMAYELHYRSFAGVDEGWEWDPSLLALRSVLEARFLGALVEEVGPPAAIDPGEVEPELRRILGSGRGPSLSAHMAERGTLDQFREFAVHRSAYQLKEADPHTWAIPRLHGRPKAALVRIQSDEYGDGVVEEMHAERFALTMAALQLDRGYGAYLDVIPGVTLATVNLISLLGLHRRWRGALVGHLAIFEMASVVPMGRYAAALRRLGVGEAAASFFDVHVAADAVHEVIAAHDLASGLAHQEPELSGDILFGARAIMAVEERFARHLLGSWAEGRSSLLAPFAVGPALPRSGRAAPAGVAAAEPVAVGI